MGTPTGDVRPCALCQAVVGVLCRHWRRLVSDMVTEGAVTKVMCDVAVTGVLCRHCLPTPTLSVLFQVDVIHRVATKPRRTAR